MGRVDSLTAGGEQGKRNLHGKSIMALAALGQLPGPCLLERRSVKSTVSGQCGGTELSNNSRKTKIPQTLSCTGRDVASVPGTDALCRGQGCGADPAQGTQIYKPKRKGKGNCLLNVK